MNRGRRYIKRMLVMMMLVPMLASAQTVSDVQNSGCLSKTRGDESQSVPTIVLTKEGSILSVQLLNYEENCCAEDFNVSSSISGGNDGAPLSISISVDASGWECDCICPFNVSFTVRDLEPNSFYLDCWWYKGRVELSEGEPLMLEYGNSNTPKYFPTGMTWEEIVVNPDMELEDNNACVYEIGTDTIVGNVTYKKVLKNNEFSGLCVRESGDKVWLLAKEYPTEILLYNFDWDSNQEIVTEYLKEKDDWEIVDYEVCQETTPVGNSQTVEIEGKTYQYIMKRHSGTIIRGIGKVAELNRYPCLLSYREPAVILPGLDYHKVHWIRRNGVEIFRSESAKEWTEEIMDEYRPMIEDGKVWKVGSKAGISDGIVKMVGYYYFDGDTIINGKPCKRMMFQRYVNPDYPDYDVIMRYIKQVPLLSYVGSWYEEDKKVYLSYAEDKLFKLMYDFSFNANDTLWIDKYYPFIIGPEQTGGIKGFKGVYRNVMTPWEDGPSTYNTTWLEGVGSIEDPTLHLYYGYEGHLYFLMSCTVGDEVIYLNDKYEDGATPMDAEAKKHRFDFTHKIKTNPQTPSEAEEQSLYGEYNNQLLDIRLNPLDDTYLVRITNESDQVVYEKNVNAGNIVGLNIDISAFAKGRYTVTMENSSEVFTGEFETITTGIQELKDSRIEGLKSIYNLQGQRLNRMQKGLNIVNGRKVFVK